MAELSKSSTLVEEAELESTTLGWDRPEPEPSPRTAELPGKQTLALVHERGAEVAGAGEGTPGKRTRAELVESQAPPQDGPQALNEATHRRMGALFGSSFSDIKVFAGSPQATGATRALARGDEIHFREGAYQPDTPDGDRVIAHELAHVLQLRGGQGRSGERQDLEREADRAAGLVGRGLSAPVSFSAPAGSAYAYRDDETHDFDGGDLASMGLPPIEGGPAPNVDAGAAEADTGAGAAPEELSAAKVEAEEIGRSGRGRPAEGEPHPAGLEKRREEEAEREEKHAGESQPGGHQDEPGTTGAHAAQPADQAGGGDAHAELSAIGAEPIPGEAAPDAGGGGRGGAEEKKPKEPPSVAGEKPEAAFSALHGVRVDKVATAIGQVHTAIATDVAQERAAARANPPKQMSSGAAPAGKGPVAAGGSVEHAGGGGGQHADQPVKVELGGEQAAKAAQQDHARGQQVTAGQVIQHVAGMISGFFAQFTGGPAAGAGGPAADGAKGSSSPSMSDGEKRQLSTSLSTVPTRADVSTTSGDTPHIEMKGEAAAQARSDRLQLDSQARPAEGQANTDAATPMGEDHIETSVHAEELTAKIPAGGEGPHAALPTIAGAAETEEIGIIAQEKHGAEVDAALAKASGDVAGERARHKEAEAQARSDGDKQIQGLKQQADAEQASARGDAKAAAAQARTQWQAEIARHGQEARTKADAKVAEGMAEVDAHQAKANEEAQKHAEEGQQKAEEEKAKGEREADEAKKKGEHKSGGFFGWLSSKAKALVDGVKKAVSAAIDAAKQAVKTVLDAAKKLAMAAIDLARKAITATIQAVGRALIAISNVLLAAFPELKKKFQSAIQSAVDKAVQTVDKIADGLKKAVQKALDLIGAALDKALGLLEKGLNALVDAVGAVVQGAIKAAQAIAAALGEWLKILKDVASGPAAWLGNLGHAVVDGIKNHLWGAFKGAVVDWFKSKIFELLGVGGIILQILLDGGINEHDIVQMAMQALMVAIPAALIAILIEKLVSMIVPAAGAVLAVVQGLQAAWGTISRIIAAMGAFIAFLLAVKSGGAGPLFATLLASAAVVVLDFVSNWLLKKLASAARKVGDKLKGLAEKLKSKFKRKGKGSEAGHAGGAGKPHHEHEEGDGPQGKHHDEEHGSAPAKKRHDEDEHDTKKPTDDGDAKKNKKEEDKKKDKDEKNREILARAESELPPKIHSALAKGQRNLLFKARLAIWRAQYRLTSLSVEGSTIVAKVNPQASIGEILHIHREEISAHLRTVAEQAREAAKHEVGGVVTGEETNERGTTYPTRQFPVGMTTHGVAEAVNQDDPLSWGKVSHLSIGEGTTRMRGARTKTAQILLDIRDGKIDMSKISYPDIGKEYSKKGPQVVAAMKQLQETGTVPDDFSAPNQIATLFFLLHGHEPGNRSPAAGVHAELAMDLLEKGRSTEDVFGRDTKAGGLLPMSPEGATREARAADEYFGKKAKGETPRLPIAASRHIDREIALVTAWVDTLDLVFADSATAEEVVAKIKAEITKRILGAAKQPETA